MTRGHHLLLNVFVFTLAAGFAITFLLRTVDTLTQLPAPQVRPKSKPSR